MALTKDQWYSKLKGLVPTWVLFENTNAKSVFYGIAALLEQSQADYLDHVQETYIDNADTDYLDQHGLERSKERLLNEPNSSFSNRIKLIRNASNVSDLETIVNSQLETGACIFIENFDPDNFFNQNAFLNRHIISTDHKYNAITIFVSNQGNPLDTVDLFRNIISAVEKEKAFGIVWRLIER